MTEIAWIAAGLLLGTGVPVVGMRMFAPSLGASPSRINFRGREVHAGLGVVWVLWAGGAMAASLALTSGQAGPSPAGLLILAGPLALVSFALGLVDDALGSSADRGFRGHLRALSHGRLTTGMLKLLGISAASLVAAFIVAGFAPWGRGVAQTSVVARGTAVIVAGASVALTSNLLNLLDVRPGRALKGYSVLTAVGVTLAVLAWPLVPGVGGISTEALAAGLLMLGLFGAGPVLAVWREDLSERAMLGDAGANPAGAVAGLFLIAGLPSWGLALYFVLVLALNLVSERCSFTRIIENNRVLAALDGLGRAREPLAENGNLSKSSPHGEASDG